MDRNDGRSKSAAAIISLSTCTRSFEAAALLLVGSSLHPSTTNCAFHPSTCSYFSLASQSACAVSTNQLPSSYRISTTTAHSLLVFYFLLLVGP